jgi:hypothetical protein
MSKLDLGPAGVALTVSDTYLGQAAELERLGYSALWLPGGQIDDLNRLTEIVRATTAVPVGSAIISLDVYSPGMVADLYARLEASAPGRLVAGLPGYRASFARMGFTDGDIDGLSDTLVDQLVIWGDAGTIATRIGQYRQAGADHVMLHVLNDGGQPGPMEVARRLAGGLLAGRPSAAP